MPAPTVISVQLAPLYDFAVLDNATSPRTLVYNVDTGEELATWNMLEDPTGELAQADCNRRNGETA